MSNNSSFQELLSIIQSLRGPDGCDWDKKQTPHSMKAHLREECHELIEAIINEDAHEIMEECGDLLFQVLFIANLYEEKEVFTIDDALNAVNKKMITRHPHVFGDQKVDGVGDILKNWEKIKAEEKNKQERDSILEGVPASLPALTRALNIQRKAARVGFDWKKAEATIHKIKEEVEELEEELKNHNMLAIEEELGDLLFALVNFARHIKVDPETALTRTILKFTKRFNYIETKIKEQGGEITETHIDEMERLWIEAKKERG